MTKIDLNRVWDDARAMGAANKDLLAAIAGMFVLLPFVLALQLVNLPEDKLDPAASNEAVMAWYRTLLETNWYLFLGWTLLTSFGILAMLVLLLRQERPTVAESLKAAIVILPSFCVAYFLKNLALEGGMFLFVLPACYLAGRLILIAPVTAAEQEYNPLTIIQRSFILTRGNGWRIFLLLAILYGTAAIVFLVLMIVTGVIGSLFLPLDVAALISSIVGGLLVAALTALVALVSAAIYRAATAPAPTPWLPGAGG